MTAPIIRMEAPTIARIGSTRSSRTGASSNRDGCSPSGTEPTFEYRFRNGNKVEFTANEIDVPKLLEDVKDYLRSSPNNIQWSRINIGNIGYRLVEEQQMQYVGQEAGRGMVGRPQAAPGPRR